MKISLTSTALMIVIQQQRKAFMKEVLREKTGIFDKYLIQNKNGCYSVEEAGLPVFRNFAQERGFRLVKTQAPKNPIIKKETKIPVSIPTREEQKQIQKEQETTSAYPRLYTPDPIETIDAPTMPLEQVRERYEDLLKRCKTQKELVFPKSGLNNYFGLPNSYIRELARNCAQQHGKNDEGKNHYGFPAQAVLGTLERFLLDSEAK